jgi:hypothetical protein
MAEAFLEHLSRFTPDAGGLDRDALMFAAGRSSARPNRGWVTVASLLAGTQALSLLFLWPRPSPPAVTSAGSVAAVRVPPAPLTTPSSEALARLGVWSVRRGLPESEAEDRPVTGRILIETGPPLRVGGPTPQSLLN